jgi:hypothetical protein
MDLEKNDLFDNKAGENILEDMKDRLYKLSGSAFDFSMTKGDFTFKFSVSKDYDSPVSFILSGYHNSEIERALAATSSSDKEPRPFLFADGITISQLNSFLSFAYSIKDMLAQVGGEKIFSALMVTDAGHDKKCDPTPVEVVSSAAQEDTVIVEVDPT